MPRYRWARRSLQSDGRPSLRVRPVKFRLSDPESSTSVFTSTSATQPGEVYRFASGDERRITYLNDDFRCPLEQGQQLFTMLYTAGVETELLLFPPGEGHELSRSGDPEHRVERFDAIPARHEEHLASPQ